MYKGLLSKPEACGKNLKAFFDLEGLGEDFSQWHSKHVSMLCLDQPTGLNNKLLSLHTMVSGNLPGPHFHSNLVLALHAPL